jgi:phenylalanyl-tRNA synthetase beta chain
VFLRSRGEAPADERHELAALLSGAPPRSWRGAQSEADFFTAKALLAALLARLGVRWSAQARAWPFLHPGRSAAVLLDDAAEGAGEAGFLGELHPLVAAAWDLERVAVFSLDLGLVAAAAPAVSTFEPFAAVPPLRQDVAVALPRQVSAAQVLAAVRAAAGPTLERADVFDVYAGEQVGADRRSLALALTFRTPEQTLTDEDVAPVRQRIVDALQQLGGELRA